MLFISTRNCSCMLLNKCTSCFGKQLVLNACLQVSNKAEGSTACTRSLPVVRFHWILTRGSSSFCLCKCFSVCCHIYRIVTSYKYSSSHTPRMTWIWYILTLGETPKSVLFCFVFKPKFILPKCHAFLDKKNTQLIDFPIEHYWQTLYFWF